MDFSDHLPIIFISEIILDPTPTDDMEKCIYKRGFTENVFNCFKQALLKHLGIVLNTSNKQMKHIINFWKFLPIFMKNIFL